MTTIIAVRKKGRTCIVSDSLTVYGERRKEARDSLIVCTSKLLRFENIVVGFTGDSAWRHVFLDFLRVQKQCLGKLTIEDLITSFQKLWSSCRSEYLISSSQSEYDYYFSCCRIIVTTSKGLFVITIDGKVSKNENLAAIGGGYPFAYGASRAIEDLSDDPFEIAMAGIRAAAAWDPDTSAPFFGWNISETGKLSEFTILK